MHPQVARALPEFRPPVFLGHLPYPDSPDSVKSAPSPGKDDAADTSEARTGDQKIHFGIASSSPPAEFSACS